MPQAPIPPRVMEMLRRPNPAVIACVRPDGQPVSVATWYLVEQDKILVNMDETRKRLEYLRADPRVTLSALDEGNWYTHVSVQGSIVEMYDDEGLADIDRLSLHYTGHPYGNRDRRRVSALIEVERWHGWGSVG